MDKQRLLHIIESPELISKDDVQQLKAISTAFPTSSIIQMLCLKGLKLHDEFQFHRTLKQRSGQILSRKELKKLIYPETTQHPEIYFPAIPTVKTEPKTTSTVQETVIPVDNPLEKEPVAEPVIEVVEDSKAEKKRKKKAKKDKKKKKGKTQLIYPTLGLAPETIPEPVVERKVETKTPALNVVKPLEEEITPAEPPKKDEASKPTTTKNPNSFAAWLTDHSNVDTSHLLTKISADDDTIDKNPSSLEKEPSEKSVTELIDTFIETNPKVQRPKSDFFSPVSMGKKSMEDNEEFVTETLAELMASAGNAPKAIRYFEILSLNYPEKRDYFAGRISALKQGKK